MVNLLGFANRPAFEVMLNQQLEVVVVEELRVASVNHGFKAFGKRKHLFFSLMWTSFVVHSFLRYAAKVGRKGGLGRGF